MPSRWPLEAETGVSAGLVQHEHAAVVDIAGVQVDQPHLVRQLVHQAPVDVDCRVVVGAGTGAQIPVDEPAAVVMVVGLGVGFRHLDGVDAHAHGGALGRGGIDRGRQVGVDGGDLLLQPVLRRVGIERVDRLVVHSVHVGSDVQDKAEGVGAILQAVVALVGLLDQVCGRR